MKLNKRQEQKEQRRAAILSASLELFINKGYNGTKIIDIAEKVNMSMGLFFHYFESKEKVYEELVSIGLGGTKSMMEYDQENPLDYFVTVVKNAFELIKKGPNVVKIFVLMEQAQNNEDAPQVVKDMVSQVNNISMSIPLIESGQKKGSIRAGNSWALSVAFWCSIQGIAQEIALHPDTPYPDPDWIVDILRK
ncbi:MAG: transcriptional regulator, TetR family [Clostridiales bacterium]|nr:transcriptional regulator, TetR family [Clostridiales bacterium]